MIIRMLGNTVAAPAVVSGNATGVEREILPHFFVPVTINYFNG